MGLAEGHRRVRRVASVLACLAIICLSGIVCMQSQVFGNIALTSRDDDNLMPHHRILRSAPEAVKQNGSVQAQCSQPDPNARFDCYPGLFATKEKCEARGCCWVPASRSVGRQINVPYCYYPVDYPTYKLGQLNPMPWGYQAEFTLPSTPAWPPKVISKLQLHIILQSENTLRIKIVDASRARFEVPIPVPHVTKGVNTTDYVIHVDDDPFAIKVWRKSSGAMLFDSSIASAPLLYGDQYLQMSTRVSSGLVYGLGEHQGPFLHNLSAGWSQLSMWALDQPPQPDSNLYGSHPFYVSPTQDGNVHGVFLLNSNAMDVDFQPLPAVTFRTIGGILDFYIFSGPSPDAVIQQYTNVIGRPHLPPYWSLGFHLCRYGYTDVVLQPLPALTFRTIGGILDFYIFSGPSPDSVIQQYTNVIGRPYFPPYWSLGFHLCRWGYHDMQTLKTVVDRMHAAHFPYDVQWNDIDYMDSHLDWTYDTSAFAGLPDLVDDLHKNGQHYVIIVDPGISVGKPGQYAPYDDGLKQDVFVKNATGQPLVGKVWPGLTTFPDFSHPNSTSWWTKCASDFHKVLPYDGLWTDMNEPSSFLYGSTDGCTADSLDNPPYTPGISGDSLPMRTVCPSARQYGGRHYDLHNLFGHMEVNATRSALDVILPGKRSLIISRSSFPGTGQLGGKWTGDNTATWDHLYLSIPGILNFQLFGIPFLGADVCGFNGDTTEELCTRWMQLGAFYPFMRNHNGLTFKDQDPAVWSAPAQARMKAALELRYSMLPLLYTLLYQSHMNGTPVARPLFFQYPDDPEVYGIDRQFMWGQALLINPVLDEGATQLKSYYPSGRWFDYYTGQQVAHSGEWATTDVTLDTLSVNVRMMTVLVTQPAAVTTTKARYNPFQLTVALCPMNRATGMLFWDDGESSDSITAGKHNSITFDVSEGVMTSQVLNAGFKAENNMTVDHIRILGVADKPSTVTLNGNNISFKYSADTQVMMMDSFPVFSLMKAMKLTWK